MRARTDYVIGAAIVLVAFALGGVVGRVSKRCPVIETRTTEKHQEQEQHHDQQQTQAAATSSTSASTAGAKRSVLRRFRPDGTLASERVEDALSQSQQNSQAQRLRVDWLDSQGLVLKSAEVTKVTTEGGKRGWLILAKGGIAWTGERVYGGQVVRVWGPVAAGIEVTNRGAQLVAGVSF